jgi:hypothetical protein
MLALAARHGLLQPICQISRRAISTLETNPHIVMRLSSALKPHANSP